MFLNPWTNIGDRLSVKRKERTTISTAGVGVASYPRIADYFLALSNDTQNAITNLKLQKMMYYAQAWHLAIHRKRLFEGEFEAWAHGPVMPCLYDDYKSFSYKPIEREDLNEFVYRNLRHILEPNALEVLDAVVDEYFGKTGYDLELLVHSEEPWQLARAGRLPDEPCHEIIKDEWMMKYYSRTVM